MLGFKRKDKPEDRRRSERHLVRGPAQLLFGSLPRDCWVSDMSDGGVRLHAEGVDVPDEFTLLLGGRKERRDCRVVWRLGHEIGAEFTDTGTRGFASRIAGALRFGMIPKSGYRFSEETMPKPSQRSHHCCC